MGLAVNFQLMHLVFYRMVPLVIPIPGSCACSVFYRMVLEVIPRSNLLVTPNLNAHSVFYKAALVADPQRTPNLNVHLVFYRMVLVVIPPSNPLVILHSSANLVFYRVGLVVILP